MTRALLVLEFMEYVVEQAVPEDIEEVFSLYVARVKWMDDQGIDQWNNTGYLSAYPVSYYRHQQEKGKLYALRHAGNARILASAVLMEEDDYWPVSEPRAWYVHNLVAAFSAKGAGKRLLIGLEDVTRGAGKEYLRLDCAVDNAFLNDYYSSMGYVLVGQCQDGPYMGNCREKKL